MRFRGLDVTRPLNRLLAGFVAVCQNIRSFARDAFQSRNYITPPILTVSSGAEINTIRRLNDTTPQGPASGYTYVIKDSAGNLYCGNGGTLTPIATGMTPNPVAMIPFRPNTSVRPWMYVADSSPQGNVTIQTRYALSDSSVSFVCSGMLKVRSDGLIYKMGIKEPQVAPTVSTGNTSVTSSGTLAATAIPWTNYAGQNPNFNYGESNGPPNPGSPNPVDGTPPFIVDCANASTITITALSGTATINGNPAATPTTNGPTPGSTNPGGYVQQPGTPTPPTAVTVVVGAFTDGNGNVLAKGVAPYYVPSVVDVGAAFAGAITITVPSGAQDFQIGINSTGNTFNNNFVHFTISVEVTTFAEPPNVGILGPLTLAYWGDSPSSGPVGSYIWKNPGDTGGGISRTVSNAVGTDTGNSFIFDATFTAGIPSTPGTGTDSVPMQWYALSAESAVTGSSPVFPSPITTTYPNQTTYANFNFCLYGSIWIPEPGLYTFVLTSHDDCIWGIEDAVLVSAIATGSGEGGGVALSGSGQTITVAQGYPLLPRQQYTSGEGGNYAQTTVVLSFAASGVYGIEIDYDYWFHSGRILLLEASPTPGASATIIPPLTQSLREDVSYAATYYSSLTGAESNPSPASTPQTTPVLANVVSIPWSDDPQVDKVNFYRQDSGLANYTFVGQGPNTNPPTAITDSETDADVADNPTLNYDNFEPFPSIDLPASGVVNVSGGVITLVSGTPFNLRWLAGTVILIGYPTQLAYTLIARPTSTSTIDIPGVPDGTNLNYNIAEPILAAQPMGYMFGPTDNINYAYANGDYLRPGTQYWCKGSNLDAAPDTNQADVTDPSEALVNGAMTGGLAVVASIRRQWIIEPNFYNAEATAEGTVGNIFSFQATEIPRGLYMPRCIAVSGGGLVFSRVIDGIIASSAGAPSKSITDDSLYNLFPHEGGSPSPITRDGTTFWPPNDSSPQSQQFNIQGDYVYYDYLGIDSTQHTIVYDMVNASWQPDTYPELDSSVITHATNSGFGAQGVLLGADSSVYAFTSSPTGSLDSSLAQFNVVTGAIGGVGFQHLREITLEYAAQGYTTVSFFAADEGNGSYAPNPLTLPPTGGSLTKWKSNVSVNKYKLLQIGFSGPIAAGLIVNLDGTSLNARDWGSSASYRPTNPFGGNVGGEGSEP
jgi:hypothetical protein